MENSSKIFIIGDTHFFHKNIIKYCHRPKNFEEITSRNLFKMLTPDDILIHLGDVALGDILSAHNKYIKPLYCKKWLVLGNHDTKPKSWYLNNGWDFVADSFTGVYFGKRIVFSHKPMPDEDYDLNIHGHFHNNNRDKWEPELKSKLTEKHILYSLEEQNYKPVLLRAFIGL